MAQWMAGTSKDEWGNPIWSEPYGDDPADQAAILMELHMPNYMGIHLKIWILMPILYQKLLQH